MDVDAGGRAAGSPALSRPGQPHAGWGPAAAAVIGAGQTSSGAGQTSSGQHSVPMNCNGAGAADGTRGAPQLSTPMECDDAGAAAGAQQISVGQLSEPMECDCLVPANGAGPISAGQLGSPPSAPVGAVGAAVVLPGAQTGPARSVLNAEFLARIYARASRRHRLRRRGKRPAPHAYTAPPLKRAARRGGGGRGAGGDGSDNIDGRGVSHRRGRNGSGGRRGTHISRGPPSSLPRPQGAVAPIK